MIVNAGYRGKVGAALNFTYTGKYNIRKDGVVELLTSGTIVFLEPKVIDVFMVGGGGSGIKRSGPVNSGYGGGGGGYTRTVRRINVSANTNITVTVGAGGVAENSGGSSAFSNYAVNGGVNGGIPGGGKGGSGGGSGVTSNSNYGAGGSDGGNGEDGEGGGSASKPGGSGQGFTTREFGEAAGKLYAGGGGGGRYMVSATPIISIGGSGGGGSGAWVGTNNSQAAAAGVANTGGGGGGGANHLTNIIVDGASGGSGIVCFRDAQELPELAGTWVLNERMYAPENNFDETINFTGITTTGVTRSYKRVYTSGGILYCQQTSGSIDVWYTFSTNNWALTFRTMVFDSGATASDAFRAWLASNATKQ
nr:MAG TPA: hypothetical protein [Caudoviricetes sp.]